MKSLLLVLYFVVNGNLFATININQCDWFPNVRDVCFLPSGDAEKYVNMILAGDTVIVKKGNELSEGNYNLRWFACICFFIFLNYSEIHCV